MQGAHIQCSVTALTEEWDGLGGGREVQERGRVYTCG